MLVMLLVVNVWTKSMSLVNTVEWLRSLSDLFVKCFCQLFWTGWCIIFNRRFMKSKNFHFQIEANFKTFLMKMSLHENRKKFSYRWLWTSPHFETDVWGKWKMTYRVLKQWNGGHIGVPNQWNGGHVSVPNQSSGSCTLFSCKHFLLFQ